MRTHGLLSLPFSKDRETSTYDLGTRGDHIHAASQRANNLDDDLLPFGISSQAQFDTALTAVRNCHHRQFKLLLALLLRHRVADDITIVRVRSSAP